MQDALLQLVLALCEIEPFGRGRLSTLNRRCCAQSGSLHLRAGPYAPCCALSPAVAAHAPLHPALGPLHPPALARPPPPEPSCSIADAGLNGLCAADWPCWPVNGVEVGRCGGGGCEVSPTGRKRAGGGAAGAAAHEGEEDERERQVRSQGLQRGGGEGEKTHRASSRTAVEASRRAASTASAAASSRPLTA